MNFLCMALNSLSRFSRNSNQRGFTLVELAIVLVIVGLLIGGILVAQSMISTAKINSQVRQFQQFDTAVANFTTRYNAVPADFCGIYSASEIATYSLSTCGNNVIDVRDWAPFALLPGRTAWVYDQWSEAAWFWVSLQRGVGFNQDGATFTAIPNATSFNITSSVRNGPKSAISNKASIVAVSSYHNYPVSSITAYTLANYSDLNSGYNAYTSTNTPVITPSQALAIDKKMDDGAPITGMVYAWMHYASPAYLGWSADSVYCSNGTVYFTSESTNVCALTVQIMSQSGGIPGRGTTY